MVQDDMYLNYYGFRVNPFSDAADPSFLFYSKNHKEVMGEIIREIDKPQAVIVLSGASGTGKSTVLNALDNLLPKKYEIARICGTATTPKELIEAILGGFGLECKGRSVADHLFAFHLYLNNNHRSRKKYVLIVDDAHQLSYELIKELLLISRFEGLAHSFLQIILAGRPQIVRMLNDERLVNLQNGKPRCLTLNALAQEETSAYIDRRVSIAGWSGQDALYTPGAINLIKNLCHGWPTRINAVCDRALTAGFDLKSDRIDSKIVLRVMHSLIPQLEDNGHDEKPRQDKTCGPKATDKARDEAESNGRPHDNQTEETQKPEVDSNKKPSDDEAVRQAKNGRNRVADPKPAETHFRYNARDTLLRIFGIPLNAEGKSSSGSRQISRKNGMAHYDPLHLEDLLSHVESIIQNIVFNHQNMKVIGITSAVADEGTSTLASLLSLAASEKNGTQRESFVQQYVDLDLLLRLRKGTLLIDTNFEHPGLHEIFDISPNSGCGQMISSAAPSAAIKMISPSLRVMTTRSKQKEARSRTEIEKLASQIESIKFQFDLVFLDIPPILNNPQSIILSKICDGVILDVCAGQTRREVVIKAKRVLQQADVNIIGAILNKRKDHIPQRLYRMMF